MRHRAKAVLGRRGCVRIIKQADALREILAHSPIQSTSSAQTLRNGPPSKPLVAIPEAIRMQHPPEAVLDRRECVRIIKQAGAIRENLAHSPIQSISSAQTLRLRPPSLPLVALHQVRMHQPPEAKAKAAQARAGLNRQLKADGAARTEEVTTTRVSLNCSRVLCSQRRR